MVSKKAQVSLKQLAKCIRTLSYPDKYPLSKAETNKVIKRRRELIDDIERELKSG